VSRNIQVQTSDIVAVNALPPSVCEFAEVSASLLQWWITTTTCFSTSGKHANYVKCWNGCLCHDPEEVSSAIFCFIRFAVEQIWETLIAIFWKCSWIVSFDVPKRDLLFSIWLSCKLRAIHELNGWKKVCVARIPAQLPLRSFFWHAEKWDDESTMHSFQHKLYTM